METKVLNYRIIVTPEKQGRKTVYNALSPTLGVADWGNSIDQALTHIQEAIECHLESLAKHNVPIPLEESSDFMVATTTVSLPKQYSPTFA